MIIPLCGVKRGHRSVDPISADWYWILSVDLRQELDLLTQVLLQPRQDLEDIDVEIPGVGRRAVTAVASHGGVERVAHVCGAPAHYCHLVEEDETDETSFWSLQV